MTQPIGKVWTVIAENGEWTETMLTTLTSISDSESIMSLLDFEGQSLLRLIHQLFVAPKEIVVVVFNMVDMLTNRKREHSLKHLSFWINTIVFHTYNVETGKTAPVFLVGTHKDKVSDQSRHQYISDVIEEKFKYSMVWASIVEYNGLCFFPVNNHQGKPHNYIAQWDGRLFYTANELDNGIGNLRSEIERVIKDSECMKELRSLGWLKASDVLTASTKSFLTLKEASDIAIANAVEQDEVPLFLSFLKKMGMVLWLDEEGLRDVVILDVMAFFAAPASLIICNHISNPSKNTTHMKKIQEGQRKNYRTAWDRMTTLGSVGYQLINALLRELVLVDNIPVVIKLILKYGLIVRLEYERAAQQSSAVIDSDVYLVPSLLPYRVCDPVVLQNENEMWWNRVKHWK